MILWEGHTVTVGDLALGKNVGGGPTSPVTSSLPPPPGRQVINSKTKKYGRRGLTWPSTRIFEFSNFESSNYKLHIVKLPNFIFFEFKILQLELVQLSFSNLKIVPTFKLFKIVSLRISNFQKIGTLAFQHFQNFRFSDMKNNISKDVPIFSCVFEVFWW